MSRPTIQNPTIQSPTIRIPKIETSIIQKITTNNDNNNLKGNVCFVDEEYNLPISNYNQKKALIRLEEALEYLYPWG